MNWNQITLNQFKQIQQAMQIEDENDKIVALSEIIYGDNVTDLPLSDYIAKVKELNFLQTDIPNDHTVKQVNVNGRQYRFDGLLGNITTAQYLDYVNHSKSQDVARMLSVFFIPKDHKYNDGYDMQQVINDIGEMPIDIVMSSAFFFNRQLSEFIRIFRYSLTKKIKKMKVNKMRQLMMLQLLKPLESYLTY